MSKEEIFQTSKRFKQFTDLMTLSFSEKERRACEDLPLLTKYEAFAIEAYFNYNSELEYFITHWNLDKFVFIEHFALSHHLRGKGMGSNVLRSFIDKKKCPIVLEVEPPVDSISRRRIQFYERLGFTLFHWKYQQPPYRQSDDFLDLLLMTNSPELLQNKNGFQSIKAEIHRRVYA